MITPRRFSNLDYCLINISSLVIECLLQRGSTTLEGLYSYCKLSKSDVNEQDISLSVSFFVFAQ